MPLEGSVGDFGLVDIFQLIAMQKKAGMLTVSCKNKEDVMAFFLDGTFIRAFSGDENKRFANAMVSAEKITIAQSKMALRSTPKGKSVVETLIKLDCITSEEARTWNHVLTQEALFDLLSWKSGSYKFSQEPVSKMEYDNSTSVERVLMEGMRQADEWPALLKKIPSREEVYEKVKTADEGDSSMSGYETEASNQIATASVGAVTGGATRAPVMGAKRPSEQREREGEAPIPPTVPPLLRGGEGGVEGATRAPVIDLLQFINGERTVNEILNRVGIGAFPVYKELSDLLAAGKIMACDPKAKIKKEKRPLQGEKITLSKISFVKMKEFVSDPAILNGLLVSFAIILLVLPFSPVFFGEKSISGKIDGRVQTFRELLAVNNKDMIEFSLNLYYLKHNRYPDTLMQLKKYGFMDSKISIDNWVYSHDSSRFSLKFLHDSSIHK